jgi:hypothetical protein
MVFVICLSKTDGFSFAYTPFEEYYSPDDEICKGMFDMGFISLFVGSSVAPFSTQVLAMFVFWGQEKECIMTL